MNRPEHVKNELEPTSLQAATRSTPFVPAEETPPETTSDSVRRQIDRIHDKVVDNRNFVMGAAGVGLLGLGLLARKLTRQPTATERLSETVREFGSAAGSLAGTLGSEIGSATDSTVRAGIHEARKIGELASDEISQTAKQLTHDAHQLSKRVVKQVGSSLQAVPPGPALGVASAIVATAVLYAGFANWADRRSIAATESPGRSRRAKRTLDELSYRELYQRARKNDIAGRSSMSKEELLSALQPQ